MELDKNKFALSGGLTMGIVYVVCAAFVWLWPAFALQLFGWLVHLVNVDKFAGDVKISALGFIIGLVQVWIYTYIGTLVFAWLHNKFISK